MAADGSGQAVTPGGDSYDFRLMEKVGAVTGSRSKAALHCQGRDSDCYRELLQMTEVEPDVDLTVGKWTMF